MKNINFKVIGFVLSVVLIFSGGCDFSGIKGIKGSGNLKTETRNVSGFKKVEAQNAMNVVIDAGKEFSMQIEADDNLLPLIKSEVSGDKLTISIKESISSSRKPTIKISMPELVALDVSGASSGEVSNVKTDSLELDASGASQIKIVGEANKLKSDASGASGIDAERLKVTDADVKASGASNSTVTVANELKADASGASTIYYTGEPKTVTPKSSGASSVKKK